MPRQCLGRPLGLPFFMTAFRELMPLGKAPQAAYLNWAEKAFRLSASVVADSTQSPHSYVLF
ncbi:hypothetical protein [Oceanisphaera ostreae]|uniref:Cobalamin-independent methionine synthase MetE C-terminal/archaeal domain-containing protein n=1 Tax=Oceanisphaera ostreae TaxID=914151 RepID=A0ABW3KIW4_9GAMM